MNLNSLFNGDKGGGRELYGKYAMLVVKLIPIGDICLLSLDSPFVSFCSVVKCQNQCHNINSPEQQKRTSSSK